VSVKYVTFQDILEDVLFRASEDIDSTDYEQAAKRYILRAYDSICNGGTEFDFLLDIKWWWLRKQTTFTIDGSASDGKYQLAEDVNYLGDRIYTDPTSAVADYQPALESVSFQDIIGLRSYYERFDQLNEFPEKYTIVASSDGTIIPSIQFDKNWDETEDPVELSYHYLRRVDTENWPTNSDGTDNTTIEPYLPKNYRKNLADYALYFLYFDKNDTKADNLLGVIRNSLKTLKVEHNRQVNPLNDSNFMRIYRKNTNINQNFITVNSLNPRDPYNSGYSTRFRGW